MQTTYFKYENGVYSILLNNEWTIYQIEDQGIAISSLITEKMREFYTAEQAVGAEKEEGEEVVSDEGIKRTNAYWTKQKEVSDEIMSDFASFETNLLEALEGA